MNDGWDTGLEFVSTCGKICEDFSIFLDPFVVAKINILMEKKDGIEWLCFLMGEIQWENKKAYVNDLYIPFSQSVTSAKVDDINCEDDMRQNIIGVIHSHNQMGCFWSKDDWKYLNKNHNISIVVSNKNGFNEYLAVVRIKTPCGALTHIDGNVSINITISDDIHNKFVDEIDEKIKTGINEFINPWMSKNFKRVTEGNVTKYVPKTPAEMKNSNGQLSEEEIDDIVEGYYCM